MHLLAEALNGHPMGKQHQTSMLRTGGYAFSILALVLTIRPPGVMAADIRPYISGSGSYRAIVIEGVIAPGDFDTFVRIVRENQGRVSGVYCFSPGGNFYEAMKIGRAMRALELSSQAPMRDGVGRPVCDGADITRPDDPKNCTCASAAFFIHIGATHRGGTFLAVHRPYFEKGTLGQLSLSDAKEALDSLRQSAREYMTEMGVPAHVQEEVLNTASDRALVLDETTVKTYFWGDLPYIHEWMKDKCRVLSESEKERSENYSRRLASARSPSDADLSKTEWVDLDALQKKQHQELKCGVSIERQRHADAYARYFGGKPNDIAGQNFVKWSEAAKYLGKRFYEISSEEKFDEDKLGDQSSLKRAATATAPMILLFDSPSTPRAVASVDVLSSPNPSPELIQSVVSSLEKVWGKESSGNGRTEWRWTRKDFIAVLKHELVSAEGPYLNLNIDAK